MRQVLKWTMIGRMAIAIALFGFNDLGRSVTPTFLFQKHSLFTIISTLSKNEQKINVGSYWKFHDFCPRDMDSCHHAAARHVKPWLLNANLFFEEPHQLTKLIGPFKLYLTEIISLQSFNCNILGLAAAVAFFANEARFTQINVFFWACSLQNELGDPPFLLHFRHH